MYSVRLVNADSYQAQPLPQLDPTFSEFRGSEIKHVPIIRIFGTTNNGEKTCLHIHGVFPYLYVPYTAEEDPTSLAYRLSASLDAAINVSLGSATSNTQHVYLIQRVSGIPFYGYHRKEHQYLKIYFYNPAMIKRAADLLQNGSVLNQSLQPHEAHIPYILQFMMDYNVYGMSFVNLSSVKHRRLTQSLGDFASSGQSTISENNDIDYLPATIERQSTCEIEIDALASDIINRREIESGLELNPGLAAIWEEERARRAQAGFQGGDSQLVNPKSPPRPKFRPTDNDIYQEQRLARRLLMISQCDESSLSTTPNQSVAYAAEVKEGENLLNSSNLLLSRPITEETHLGDRDDPSLLDSLLETTSHRKTPDCSILCTEDAQLVDLLAKLADEECDDNQDSIDLDSLLGSQNPALQDGEKSDNDDQEDDDVTDLNLTSLQLDSLNSLEIPAERLTDFSKNDEKQLQTNEKELENDSKDEKNEEKELKNNIPTDLSPFILSNSNSSTSSEEITKKSYRLPQFDGASDLSPSLLSSDDDDNSTSPKEFSHLPEYKKNSDFASQSRKFDNHDHNHKSTSEIDQKNNEEINDSTVQLSILPPVIVNNEYIGCQYGHNSNYEPLDRLLEIDENFVPDLEGLHSSMEIGILLSSADSDSPESVDDVEENEKMITLENVLNGDPCFTESAEIDKSDLTELQDQYVSLLGNSLLPDVDSNIRIDSDLGNSSNFSDSDYQTGEKNCEILLNIPSSPRSSIASRENFTSSSENIAPNIIHDTNDVKIFKKNKSNDWKNSMRISNDNSDYNCNVVASFDEMENLQFEEKDKNVGRHGRSKEKGQNSMNYRQNRTKSNRRNDEKANSPILPLDNEKITGNTLNSSPLKDTNNYSFSPRKISVAAYENLSPIKKIIDNSLSPILEKKLPETIIVDDFVVNEDSNFLLRVPEIAAEVEVEHENNSIEMETISRVNLGCLMANSSENEIFYNENVSSDIRDYKEFLDDKKIENSEENSENRLDKINEPLKTKNISEGYSFYSSERSKRNFKAGGFPHFHCQILKKHKIVQDQVFTSDQVWVIEKRKRGRKCGKICRGICMRDDCSFPIVVLKKIVQKIPENSSVSKDSPKIQKKDFKLREKIAERQENKIIEISVNSRFGKEVIGSKNYKTGRKLRIQKNLIDSSSSEDEGISFRHVTENCIEESETKESIDGPILENKGKSQNKKIEKSEASNAVKNHLKSADFTQNSYSIKKRYSRKKRSRVRNSKRIISMKNSRPTKNGLLPRVEHLDKNDNDNLPGIPGISDYRINEKRGFSRKESFTRFNAISGENISTETPRKRKNKMKRISSTNWESKREISNHRTNCLENCVENELLGEKKIIMSPDKRPINSSSSFLNYSSISTKSGEKITSLDNSIDISSFLDSSSISTKSEKKINPLDNSMNNSSFNNRSSTPKKINNEINILNSGKLSECLTLNLMMREVKSKSTRAKLKILLEKRTNKSSNNSENKEIKTTSEKLILSDEKVVKEAENEISLLTQNTKFPLKSVVEKTPEKSEIDVSEKTDNTESNLSASFEAVTDISETSETTFNPKLNSTTEFIDNIAITGTTNLNDDICNTKDTKNSEFRESDLKAIQNKTTRPNHVEEFFNERKELSYQSDHFTTTIVENNFFSGNNNYAIDAVSLEIPACLFEEDSNSVEKRSPKKIVAGESKMFNVSTNIQENSSDLSIDYRDLDVYDVESLTSSSSLVNINENNFEATEHFSTISETTESSINENSNFSETQSVKNSGEKSITDLKSDEIFDSSFEEASPEFEALSPIPKIDDFIEPSEEEFAVHSTINILENKRDFDFSSTQVIRNSLEDIREEKINVSVDNSNLDHEIQDLVSEVVVQIENQSNLVTCDGQSELIADLEVDLKKHSQNIDGNVIITTENRSRKERGNEMRVDDQGDEKSEGINKLIDSSPKEKIFEKINSFTKENESQTEIQQFSSEKSDQIDRNIESKNKDDENYFVAETKNCELSEEEIKNISKKPIPETPSKCQIVSTKLVNIDLLKFERFQPKNVLPSTTNNIIEENFDIIVPIDENNESKSLESKISRLSKSPIVIKDTIEALEETPKELKKSFQVPKNDEEIVDKIASESTKNIGNSKNDESFEKTTEQNIELSSSPIVIFDESEIFETEIITKNRITSQNSALKNTRRNLKKSQLPARRSRRKCVEKARKKLSPQKNLQLSSSESQQSTEESENFMKNDNFQSKSQINTKSANFLTHEISKSELNTDFPAIRNSLNGQNSLFLTQEKEEKKSTLELKREENFIEKSGTENSTDFVLSMQKNSNEKKATYRKWGKKCKSDNDEFFSQENSLETSPEINECIEENTSADENIKPNNRISVYLRKSYTPSRRKRRSVASKIKISLQRRNLLKKAKISNDSQKCLQQISSDKTEHKNSSLQHCLSSQNISDINNQAKDLLLSDGIETPEIFVINKKKRLTKKKSTFSSDETSSKMLPSQEVNAQKIAGKFFETFEEFPLVSQKIVDENAEFKNFDNSAISLLNAAKLKNNSREINENISTQEVELTSQKIKENSAEPKNLVKNVKKIKTKGRPRKISASKIQEPFSEFINDQSTDIINIEKHEKSESQEIGKSHSKSEISTLKLSNLSTKKNISNLSSQKLLQNRTEPEVCVEVRKRGRPRKILSSNNQKTRQPKTRNFDEIIHENLEETKLSENLEQDENESTNFTSPNLVSSDSKIFSAAENGQLDEKKMSQNIFNGFDNKINEKDVKSKISAVSSLETTDEKYVENSGIKNVESILFVDPAKRNRSKKRRPDAPILQSTFSTKENDRKILDNDSQSNISPKKRVRTKNYGEFTINQINTKDNSNSISQKNSEPSEKTRASRKKSNSEKITDTNNLKIKTQLEFSEENVRVSTEKKTLETTRLSLRMTKRVDKKFSLDTKIRENRRLKKIKNEPESSIKIEDNEEENFEESLPLSGRIMNAQINTESKNTSKKISHPKMSATIKEEKSQSFPPISEEMALKLSPKKCEESDKEKILDKNLAESNLLTQKIDNEISETQLIVRPNRRVHIDENSTKKCNEKRKVCEKSKKVCKTTRATIANRKRDFSALRNERIAIKIEDDELKTNKDLVADKLEYTMNSTDKEFLDLTSSKKISPRQRSQEILVKFAEKPLKSKAKRQTIKSYEKINPKEIPLNGLKLGKTRKIEFSQNSKNSTTYGMKNFSLKNKKARIILPRLSRLTLKIYGIEYNSKNKTFVKKHPNKNHLDDDFQIPAYDGPADLSSSESDDEIHDFTVAREEKRVCVYQSAKKKATNEKKESIVTPGKRKLDSNESASPRSKRRAKSATSISKKIPFDSPNRTTNTLRSPSHTSGFYPALPIIITSPKVRKETSLNRETDARLENSDITGCNSSCFTPRRKNEKRLHDDLLRGRISGIKSPKNFVVDKDVTSITMGPQRPGELEEIKSGEQKEQIAEKISKISTSEFDGSTGNEILISPLRDVKDVRKKLVFSSAEHESHNIKISKEELDHQSTNLRTISQSDQCKSIINDSKKSIKNSADDEIIAIDPKPGTSNSDKLPVDENLSLYEMTTDEETENEDECNVTFTQFIDSQIVKNQILTFDRKKKTKLNEDIVSLRPKFNPPNKQRIIDTMESYGISKYRNEEPFFGNEADVVKQKELAQKMLKVPGKGFKDLTSFVSSIEGVTGIMKWRKMIINEIGPTYGKNQDFLRTIVGNDFFSFTPIIKPPTQKDVKNWLRARNYLEKRRKKNEKEKDEGRMKKIQDTKTVEIHDKINEAENEELEANDSDVSVIEASPEKNVGGKDSENLDNFTLKMKLAKRGLSKNSEDLKKCGLSSLEREEKGNFGKTSKTSREKSSTENSSSTEIDPSLLSVLEKSNLFKDQETSRHLGVSCGQIEFLSDSTRSNIANENLQNAKALTRYQYLTIMCLEVHVSTRGDLLPDAQHDAIAAIFYSVQSDVPPTSHIKPLEHGVIVLADEEKANNKMHYAYASNIPWSIFFANNEEALLNNLVTLITRIDPEILIGWELETLSWGYVFQRATRLGMNLSKRISRIPATQCKWETPQTDIESMAQVKLPGRIVLDIWRMMRHEAALLSYTFESVMHHVLNERVPCPSFKVLTDWWNLKQARPSRWRVIEHYSLRVLGVFRMLDQLDIIGRTSELARLFGIQFYEVFSRGSQYRVESVMLRLAKPLNYIAVSPTPLQRASMRAMEALPLILEPESKFYSDPLIVLDFQSLYPSIIIAHNYCFSTCLGRIEHIGQPQPFEFGAYTLRVSKSEALRLAGKVNYAPCGVAYVKPEVRLGILPRMLTEILETRFMVKKAMKDHKQADKTLQRALHSRQHGLKFLANVTYGYTAANFSGRMPCIEVGDSVISKSKETLERAIKLVESTPKWGARVVYGDTDSLFILVPGKSKDQAFVIGNEIADAVTASNLPPIKLKFEKVMYPAILQTKKRYCGYMYETPDQKSPTYLAKGIETVRRDGCPAVSKILEKTLKILFETKDVSLVKKYVTRQLDKILRGKVSIQDLTFAKEFRGLKGYKAKACVPALELTRRLMRKDPRAVPRNSERVRYVIVAGAPNQALIHCVRTPWELINDPGLRPNAIYYITRVIIPPLNRCLNLMGVDVNTWYREMPHRQILNNPVDQPVDKQKLTIFQYFGTIVCVSCGEPSSKGICAKCLANPADTLVVLHEKLRWLHRTYDHVTAICQSCVGRKDNADCSSLECPVLYRRAQAKRELSKATHLQDIIKCGNSLEF